MHYIGPKLQPGQKPSPDHILVEIQVRNLGTGNWGPATVSLRTAWAVGMPGLVPPAGRNAA